MRDRPELVLEYLLEDELHLSVKGHDLYLEIVGPPLVRAFRTVSEADGRS